jgi:CRP-like cAMP-binding protein
MAIHTLLLQQFPLLKPLPAETLERIGAMASVQRFGKREVVLRKSSLPRSLCFLIEGRLQGIDFTLDGREVGLYFIEPGDYFAELALIDDEAQPEHIIANSPAQVVFVPASAIRPILFATPAMAEAVSRRLAQRVRAQILQRQILGLTNPLQRVCAQLESLRHGSDPRILKAPTQQEIAIMVNLTRETVTRSFQVLLAKRVLTREGDDLLVDGVKLAEIAAKGPGGDN